MNRSSGIIGESIVRNVKICGLYTYIVLLFGCAAQNQTGYMPDQYLVPNNQSFESGFVGVILTKQEDGLQTMLYLGSDVATQTLLGTEIVETFYRYGWMQVTRADANNHTEVDIVCRLGALSSEVSVQCLSDSRVAPGESTGSVTVDNVTIARVGGIERARNAVVSLVDRQRTIVVNEAVRIRLQQGG